MFIAANCFVAVIFFRSRTSRYAHFKNIPSALRIIHSESLLPNPSDGFRFIMALNKAFLENDAADEFFLCFLFKNVYNGNMLE